MLMCRQQGRGTTSLQGLAIRSCHNPECQYLEVALAASRGSTGWKFLTLRVKERPNLLNVAVVYCRNGFDKYGFDQDGYDK